MMAGAGPSYAESLVVPPWGEGMMAGAGPSYACESHWPGAEARPRCHREPSELGERLPCRELREFRHWGRLVRRVSGVASFLVSDVRAGFSSSQSPRSSLDSLPHDW